MGSIFVSFMHIFFWEIFNIFFSIFVMIHTDLAWNGNYRFLSFFIICLVCHLVFPLFYCKWMLFWIILFVTDFNISYLRQAGRQTSRQTDRQTDRQRKTERDRDRERQREMIVIQLGQTQYRRSLIYSWRITLVETSFTIFTGIRAA